MTKKGARTNRVREYLLDNVGLLTYPGNASYDRDLQHWFVPVFCRTNRGSVIVGDIEVDEAGHIVWAPSRDEMVTRVNAVTSVTP